MSERRSEGVGECGYMSAPAAVAGAVNDPLAPLGVRLLAVPATPDLILRLIQGADGSRGGVVVSTGR